jgi:hypothetical protein
VANFAIETPGCRAIQVTLKAIQVFYFAASPIRAGARIASAANPKLRHCEPPFGGEAIQSVTRGPWIASSALRASRQ